MKPRTSIVMFARLALDEHPTRCVLCGDSSELLDIVMDTHFDIDLGRDIHIDIDIEVDIDSDMVDMDID